MLGIPINESTVGGAVLLAVGLLAVLAAGFVTGLVWVTACKVARWRKSRRHDASPDVFEELAAHLSDYVAANPELEAGFARLRAAIRDEQKGEQP
ncbi:hypothetical protein [Streptomyces sp. NPDC020298]|uniref:hypothetical protein n=1 Tax=unclassified Streptomyces TaxID=2593676 RepID=UPI0033F8BAB0